MLPSQCCRFRQVKVVDLPLLSHRHLRRLYHSSDAAAATSLLSFPPLRRRFRLADASAVAVKSRLLLFYCRLTYPSAVTTASLPPVQAPFLLFILVRLGEEVCADAVATIL